MTRFLCSGDIHLGVRDLDDQERILDQIAETAAAHDVDAVLLAGDIFHYPKPEPPILHVFQRFVQKLERAALPAIAIVGDRAHDVVNSDVPCALELFQSDWFHVSRRPEMIRTVGDVAVCTLPAVTENRVVAKQDSREGAAELAAAMLLETAGELFRQVPDEWPSVLLAHHAVAGAALPNGLPVSDLHKPMLPVDSLELLGFDAVVLGDIHRWQMLNYSFSGRPIFYVGSPGCWDFGEAGYEHGVAVLDTAGPLAAQFVPLEDRRFVTVDVDLTGVEFVMAARADGGGHDETDQIAQAIDLPIEGAVVRIRYRCSPEQARRVDVQALKAFLHEAGVHRIHQIVPEIVRASRARAEQLDERLDPLSAVDAYMVAKSIDGDRGVRLRELAVDTLEAVAA